ncbi:MAG TPA: peptidylprolyl isomerase [Desulfuromonadales bacterium]|nr:peptidylprolyl isomerase [Desulfuromonadales bacterium]
MSALLVQMFICLLLLIPTAAQATTVRLQTVLGNIDIMLFDNAAPQTVANFLKYLKSGAYNNTFIHRSVPGFVVQGGGYALDNSLNILKVPAGEPVKNEFSADRSNLRGTVAMAKVGGNPDSATTEWFFNLGNNSANLDNQNGGFTVFGMVIGNGMDIVDAIAKLQTQAVSFKLQTGTLPLTDFPLINFTGSIAKSNLVLVNSATVLSPSPDADRLSDRLFNFLEAKFPQFFSPAGQPSATISEYYYRNYPGNNSYIVTSNGSLYYLGPLSDNKVLSLGPLSALIPMVTAAGF